jgi:uncharacterized delta-60 repeat protein
VQSDGKILTQSGSPDEFVTLQRYNADGTVDRSFGDKGEARFATNGGQGWIQQLLLRPDGSMVAAVETLPLPSFSTPTLTLYLLGASGKVMASHVSPTSWDGGFGEPQYESIALDAQGNVVVLNSTFGSQSHWLTRLNGNDLTADLSYGNSGQVTLPSNVNWSGLQKGADGSLVLNGSNNVREEVIARLDAEDNLDTSYATDGLLTLQESSSGSSGTILTDSAGDVYLLESDTYGVSRLARYKADGALDTSFGDGGTVLLRGPTGSSNVFNGITFATMAGGQKLLVYGDNNNNSQDYSVGLAAFIEAFNT